MGVIMKEVILAVVLIVVGFFAVTTCVNFANAKETTTLEDALERPVVVHRHFDEETHVACYWTDRHPKYLSCVQVHNIGYGTLKRIKNDQRD
jgi:hypothetical protein